MKFSTRLYASDRCNGPKIMKHTPNRERIDKTKMITSAFGEILFVRVAEKTVASVQLSYVLFIDTLAHNTANAEPW